MGASSSPAPGVFSPMLTDGSVSDAEIMLRVKTGDQSAFEYLVQKYRRPIVSFMYRMARNAAAAEDLAFEGGYRHSDYTEGFKTNTYKLGLEWVPVRDLRLRSSYQRAVRAPNILELFNPAAVVLDGSTDPCTLPITGGRQSAV